MDGTGSRLHKIHLHDLRAGHVVRHFDVQKIPSLLIFSEVSQAPSHSKVSRGLVSLQVSSSTKANGMLVDIAST